MYSLVPIACHIVVRVWKLYQIDENSIFTKTPRAPETLPLTCMQA